MKLPAPGALIGLALVSFALLATSAVVLQQPALLPVSVPAIESAPRARFTDAIVAQERDSAASDAVFPSGAPRLYAAADLVDVPAGSRVGVRWISLRAGPAGEGTVFSADEMVLDSRLARASFILGRPAGGWVPGAYRVEMLLDERVQSSLAFLVQ